MNFFLRLRFVCFGLVVLLTGLALLPVTTAAADTLVYFGTYTGKQSKGIYVSRLDARSGQLSAPELAVEATSPSFLAASPNGRFLYAVNEVSDFGGKKAGAVSAFAIDRATGKLTALNTQSSVGAGPCHLIVDKAGKNVLVANYGGGSVAVLPVQKDGRLKEASAFIQHVRTGVKLPGQKGPHAHGIYLDNANRFAYVADAGLDQVLIYRFDADAGTLVAHEPPFVASLPEAAPRHFALRPDGRFAYAIMEKHCTVMAFACDAKRGQLTELQTISTLPEGHEVKPGYSTAELFAHPSGKFLYGSNRGHDTIVVYAIAAKSGQLTLVEHVSTQGKIPRGFGIDPSGRWLLAGNQNSDTVVVFAIHAKTGRLTPTGQTLAIGAPVSMTFVRAK